MWYDRDIDAVMRRTSRRAIPMGKIEPGEALTFGIVLAVSSVIIMALATNFVAAAWLALSIAFYVFVYTMWLKRRTPQNIVIGGAAGAFPPVIGWAAVSGHVSAMPLLLFGIVFLWTPPHFWALALYACKDYGRAGVPMLPVVAGARHTRLQILLYTLVLLPFSALPWLLGYAGAVYGLTAIALGFGFVLSAVLVWRDKQDAEGVSLTNDVPARAAFRFSLAYLAILFSAVAVDHFFVV
jgi:protoheme IX farnesyltransferase